ncbi:hypothetical protein Pcinc_040198 [Petrolisthes cinctipes]|uniref:Reverse transcriptase domain-containing protein n=1 Tax=Petrolisthes cinctipes TaxID=88211 RepID=A0AAE1EIA3_PETCI|nr:hypothetical protein Pcinc_040198 [Petrolisthes cinctipes]
MEELLNIPLEQGVQLLCYADDLVLITTGQHQQTKAQSSLDLLHDRCVQLGLKINFLKTKAMTFGKHTPDQRLSMSGTDIEWVGCHQYLGVFVDSPLTFRAHVTYLRDRAFTRNRIALEDQGAIQFLRSLPQSSFLQDKCLVLTKIKVEN